jgi:hypothetical protein
MAPRSQITTSATRLCNAAAKLIWMLGTKSKGRKSNRADGQSMIEIVRYTGPGKGRINILTAKKEADTNSASIICQINLKKE